MGLDLLCRVSVIDFVARRNLLAAADMSSCMGIAFTTIYFTYPETKGVSLVQQWMQKSGKLTPL